MMTYISDYYISQDSHNTLFKNQDCHFKQLYHQLGEEVPRWCIINFFFC